MDVSRLRRVIYRASYRGFREADLILGAFAKRYASSLSTEDLDLFEALLDLPDHDLYNWIIGREPIPAVYATPLMARLCAYRFELFQDRGQDLGA